MAHTVRTITAAEHAAFNRTPAVGELPADPGLGRGEDRTGGRESLGWFDADGTQIGAGLVLYRQLPADQALPGLSARRAR